MTFDIWVTLFWFYVGSLAAKNVGLLLAGTIYDLKRVKQQAKRQKHPHARAYRERPLVSVIVPVFNNADVLADCLQSIAKSSYRKHEIIIVDDHSADSSRSIAQEFIVSCPKQKVVLHKKSKHQGREMAIAAGKRKAKGEVILILNAHSTLDTYTLANTVGYMQESGSNQFVLNTQVTAAPSVMNVWRRFDALNANWFNKFRPMPSEQALFYRRNKRPKQHLTYADNAVIRCRPQTQLKTLWQQMRSQTNQEWQTVFGGSLANRVLFVWLKLVQLLEPVIFAYSVYLLFSYYSALLITVNWLVLASSLVVIVWFAAGSSFWQKLRLSLFIPMMFIVSAVMAALQSLALLVQIISTFLWPSLVILTKGKNLEILHSVQDDKTIRG